MVKRMEARPPAMIENLVRALTPPACREHVLGDLNERHVSPRQYLFDALSTLPYLVGSRLRRTTHPLGVVFGAIFLWWAVFWGNGQESPLAATIPTVITLAILALRDAYRGATPKWGRAVAMDIAIAAFGVLLCQAVLAAVASNLVLTQKVRAGEQVRAGQAIGKVGNSGNTSEPHLHVHAVHAGTGGPLRGTGVALLFEGEFLVRNMTVRTQ